MNSHRNGENCDFNYNMLFQHFYILKMRLNNKQCARSIHWKRSKLRGSEGVCLDRLFYKAHKLNRWTWMGNQSSVCKSWHPGTEGKTCPGGSEKSPNASKSTEHEAHGIIHSDRSNSTWEAHTISCALFSLTVSEGHADNLCCYGTVDRRHKS